MFYSGVNFFHHSDRSVQELCRVYEEKQPRTRPRRVAQQFQNWQRARQCHCRRSQVLKPAVLHHEFKILTSSFTSAVVIVA